MIAGVFNMCTSLMHLINDKFPNMILNIGMTICNFLIAIICAIIDNK